MTSPQISSSLAESRHVSWPTCTPYTTVLQDHMFIVNCHVFLCIAKHLQDFTVGLTNTLPTTTFAPQNSYHVVCLVHSGVFPAWGTLTCTNIARGRYLFIQINGDLVNETIPSLCEVDVYCKCTHYICNWNTLILTIFSRYSISNYW